MSKESPYQPNKRLLPWIAKGITGFGKLYNHYQVKGLEHLPSQGGALLVLYHGLVPIDFWYLGLTIFQETNRVPCALVDRWLFKTPGLKQLTQAVGGIVAEREVALQVLREGHIVGVSPGGTKEAISGNKNHYQLVWGGRKGFAELAIQAQVPIIPGFTQNIEGAYKTVGADRPFFQNLYQKTRLPLVPIYGLGPLPFPVPLTTWLGEPISSEGQSVEDLVEKTRLAIESLIQRYQVP